MTSRFRQYIRRPNVQHILSFSGGKDSTATYLIAMELGLPFRAIFADTGNEHELTLQYVSELHLHTGGPKIEWIKADFSSQFEKKRQTIRDKWPEDGVPQERVEQALALFQPSGIPMLDLCMLKGRFPSTRARFCTDELKRQPMLDQIIFPALRIGPVVNWHGVRAQESDARAKYGAFGRDDAGATIWRPIYHLTHEQVFDIHRKHGIEPNPLYKLGMGRVGCMPCIMARKDEIRVIAQRYPEHVARIAEWERIVSEVSKRGVSTFFADGTAPYPKGYDPEKSGYYTIHEIVRWSKTSQGGKQFSLDAMQSAPVCASLYGLCE